MKLTYSICQDLIKRGRGNTKKLSHNTYLIKQDDTFIVTLHANMILRINPDKVEHFNGGWNSKTTKDRLNEFGHLNIFQKKYVWYSGDKVEFVNGVAVYYA